MKVRFGPVSNVTVKFFLLTRAILTLAVMLANWKSTPHRILLSLLSNPPCLSITPPPMMMSNQLIANTLPAMNSMQTLLIQTVYPAFTWTLAPLVNTLMTWIFYLTLSITTLRSLESLRLGYLNSMSLFTTLIFLAIPLCQQTQSLLLVAQPSISFV